MIARNTELEREDISMCSSGVDSEPVLWQDEFLNMLGREAFFYSHFFYFLFYRSLEDDLTQLKQGQAKVACISFCIFTGWI